MTIVIAAVPYVETQEAIMAPALLKSSLSKHNIDSVALDLNIHVVNFIESHPKKQKIADFFFSQIVHPDVVDDLYHLINYCSSEIARHQPKIIALSLLVYSCQIFTRWLCASLRYQCPDARIVIGGTGIKNFIADDNTNFCFQVKDFGLVDDYINGDGDISFVEYVKGNYNYPGINTTHWQPMPDLNLMAVPDFSDYNFDLYQNGVISVNDTRGCVKNCEFCDVIEYWTKFQFRTADNIFAEMLHQIKKLNRYKFAFRSSLVNGNLKEFKKLLDLIAEYNLSHSADQQISWEGYFIVRSSSQHPEDLWKKIKTTNGTLLIGVESVVQRIRNQLGKTFLDEDLDYQLDIAQKYQVPLVLLMIVAYPTETFEDYEFTKQWFRDHRHYAQNSVKHLNLSFASILPGTQLKRNSEKYNIKQGRLPSIWINQKLNITTQQRIEYLLELKKICQDVGFKSITNEQTIEHSVTDEN
jgi:hypothetical protein